MSEEKKLIKLDLGCGDNKKEGFTGVDKFKTPSVDVEHDLFTFPWPFESESVEEVHSSHFIEHIPQYTRPRFYEELCRILVPGGKALLIAPYGKSARALQDFTHEWPPIVEGSFLYLNKAWREQNKLTHGLYDIKCDFDFTYGYALSPATAVRNQEAGAFALQNYWDAAQDLYVTLIKK